MYTEEEKTDAIKRLSHQAEIGGWFNDLSTVPVRIGDLYKMLELLKDKDSKCTQD